MLIPEPSSAIFCNFGDTVGFTSTRLKVLQTAVLSRTLSAVIHGTGTGITYWFNAANGVSYRIEHFTDLENWFTLEDNIPGAGGEIVRYYDTVGTQKRFYRAKRND